MAVAVNAQQLPDAAIDLRDDAVNSENRVDRLSALWSLSDLYREQGKLREALRVVNDARDQSQSESELTITSLRRAGITLGLGMTTEAGGLLSYVRERSELLNPTARIVLLLEEGNYGVEGENLPSAIGHFEEAAAQAEAIGDAAL